MIKIQKTKQPQILADNAASWTKEYLSYINTNQKPPDDVAHRYKHRDIKSALETETYGKCAYCESKLKHIEYADIEHILPKTKTARPDLYVDWSNLTLSCEICNRTNKKDYFDPKLPLINPYIDEPHDHFLFLGPLITAKANDNRAFTTDLVLKLNREALILQRNERLAAINKMYFSWETQDNQTIKDALRQELLDECAPDKEYSAFVKEFLVAKGFIFPDKATE